jgi:hypothetical protein
LDRLERALERRRDASDEPADTALKGEVEALREECGSLRHRLALAEERNVELKGRMAHMGTRLDAAIGDLDGLITAKAAE